MQGQARARSRRGEHRDGSDPKDRAQVVSAVRRGRRRGGNGRIRSPPTPARLRWTIDSPPRVRAHSARTRGLLVSIPHNRGGRDGVAAGPRSEGGALVRRSGKKSCCRPFAERSGTELPRGIRSQEAGESLRPGSRRFDLPFSSGVILKRATAGSEHRSGGAGAPGLPVCSPSALGRPVAGLEQLSA